MNSVLDILGRPNSTPSGTPDLRCSLEAAAVAVGRRRENMPVPVGAVQAISAAAATIFSLGIAFLWFWAYGPYTGQLDWKASHSFVLVPAVCAFVLLGLVPWLATRSGAEDTGPASARTAYLVGVVLLLLISRAGLVLSLNHQ